MQINLIFEALIITAARSLDMLDNRFKSIKLFKFILKTDPYCVEALDYLVQKSLLNSEELNSLIKEIPSSSSDKEWLNSYLL